MAITATTLAGAMGAGDISANLTAITGIAVGTFLKVDGEFMKVTALPAVGTVLPNLLRGQEGTAQVAHPVSTNVVIYGTAADLPGVIATVDPPISTPAQRPQPAFYYSAVGAITPVQGLHVINGTSPLAMTLANPQLSQDGERLLIVCNGKAAHTVTYSAGLGNGGASLDVGTAASGNQCAVELVAANGFWCHIGLPSATGAANAFIWA